MLCMLKGKVHPQISSFSQKFKKNLKYVAARVKMGFKFRLVAHIDV